MSSPPLQSVISAHVTAELAAMWKTFPAIVVAVDLRNQTVSISPLIWRRRLNPETGEAAAYEAPVIAGVPVAFYGAGEAATAWGLCGPINIGDLGLAMCCDRSINEMKSTDLDSIIPEVRRMHDIADAIWMPLHIRPFTPIPNNQSGPGTRGGVDLTNNEATILRTPGLNQPGAALYLGSAGDSSQVALGPETAAAINGVIADYNVHTHAGVTVGAGVTATPLPTTSVILAADIESPNVYAEKP